LFVTGAPGVPPALQAVARNNVAWANIVTAPNDRLEEADRLSQEALKTLGWVPALKGTRGAVLVDMGRIDEGVVLLREALQEGRDEDLHPMARATYSGALALGLLAQGRPEEAREHLARARGYYARCPLLPRVEAAMAAASSGAMSA
jgi:tetratricopeptide (TPR) repeat protein